MRVVFSRRAEAARRKDEVIAKDSIHPTRAEPTPHTTHE